MRPAALAAFAGVGVALVSLLLAAAAGGPYLSAERVNGWVVVYAAGMLLALTMAPFLLEDWLRKRRGPPAPAADSEPPQLRDERWEGAALAWGGVSLGGPRDRDPGRDRRIVLGRARSPGPPRSWRRSRPAWCWPRFSPGSWQARRMSEQGNGRGVLVTGASTGIGEATALHLERLGFRVFAGHRKPEDGERLRERGGPGLEPIRIDVTDEAEIAAAAELVGDRLYGLVNNAGIPVPGAVELLPLDDLRRQLEVNLIGAVAVTQAFLPMLRAAKGRILNVTSVGGRVATPYMSAYHASKFALEAVSDSLRRELLPQGVDVIAIEPGAISTPIWSKGQEYAATVDELPSELDGIYRDETDVAMKAAVEADERGLEPAVAAEAIANALTTRRPKARYVVGRDARQMIAAQSVLPTRLFDRVLRRGMGFK